MKKIIALLLSVLFVFSLAACGDEGESGSRKKKSSDTENTAAANPNKSNGDIEPGADASADAQPTEPLTDINGNPLPANLPDAALTSIHETFSSYNYTLYMNVFQDHTTKQYDGQEFKLEGTFAILNDSWAGKQRYYVWGYADQTRCCCYQWEFVPTDVSALPKPGSFIRVEGVMRHTDTQVDGAMDFYWIPDAKVTVRENYTPAASDYDLKVMRATLAYVQLMRFVGYPEEYAGKTALLYGRALGPSTLQHPYYDNFWTFDFKTDKTYVPGTYLVLGGTLVSDGGGMYLQVSTAREVS